MNSVARFTIPSGHPVFAGHFPGTPIFPGVMLLDTVLHTIALATGIPMDACVIGAVKFLSPASPGDELLIEHAVASNGTIRFDVSTGVRKIASGHVVLRPPA
jgi:3-hydroxyacyl-[acyl-carrier-protein] dehydratase